MTENQYSLDEAHLIFAKKLNGEVWDLLEKQNRNQGEDERMVYAAHASCYHWLHAGSGLNHQRSEWLLARVYTVLGNTAEALSHANRCLELTDQYRELMQDFDPPFAFECVARANALAGNLDEALKYLKMADDAGGKIQDEEDKKIFQDDLKGGVWYGIEL